ncbi:DoxX family protein [Pseudobacter ginsenosidimutans]|jgi:putative oxidoreductase|uniref:Putative membrane protein YphA (DoxX/SURF4 family) n=1 Tax=Pseudobacter ginsenosidimutans TaxID=661488 RepID=A0A4Q7N3P6_9BACT|nr:DoxX family protein [Pseudobacter ginsenosidimutans]QEC44144.1 DoxX family protein [Pseudobacter ginsenosidimutans]RZS75592.1 putative membrane protein YphA (DoxX/SURF4 family) [Pseudobacter ginsenosidimutans]
MPRFFQWLDRNSDTGIFLLRLFVGFRLLEGVFDNILSWQRMQEFSDFLDKFSFPFPLFCAVLSVYAQAVAGLMIILGWQIRYAAMLMIINFAVALIMVHWGQSLEEMTVPLLLLFVFVLFLFQGAGSITVSSLSGKKR